MAALSRAPVVLLDRDLPQAAGVGDRDVPLAGADGALFKAAVEDHWRYSRTSTVASGSIEMQRILLARSLLAAS